MPAETTPGAVTFPTTSLAVKTYLAIGADLTQPPTSWVWTDITDRNPGGGGNFVRFAAGISTTQGRQDWTSTVRTSSGQLTLDNRDGRFSRRNPNSPYYGQLTFNTPIWCTVDAGNGVSTRMAMFVNEWPTRWSDRSGKDSTVPIQCAGIMRRLQQGSVLKSAMRRRILGKDEPTPVAYWPMEDGTSATSVASGLPGGRPMTGTPVFGAAFGGSAGAVDFTAVTDRGLTANVALPDANGFQVEFMYHGDQLVDPVSVSCGTLVDQFLIPGNLDGLPHWVATSFVQIAGGGFVRSKYFDGVLTDCAVMTLGVGTLSSSLSISVRNLTSPGTDAGLAHLTVYGFADVSMGQAFLGPPPIVAPLGSPATRTPAATAYAGELATTRIRRLAAEEGVPMVCTSGVSQAMGAQPIDTFMNVLRECEAVDNGVLYEANWGLAYQSLDDRINMPVTLALDFKQRHIAVEPEPADDDQRLRNRWTVSRTSASEATAEQTSGPFGTQAGGPGAYEDSATVNVEADTQLADQAGWRLHLSTVDVDRWPSIAIRLHGTSDLIPTWEQMQVGQRVTAANPPSQVAPDTIDAVMEGWSERWDTKSWLAELNTSPFSPYRIAIVEDPAAPQDTPRVGSGTATLVAAINTTDASLSVTTGTGGLWTTLAADFPLDINIGGERIRLSAISGSSSPQTFTVSARSVNGIVKAHSAGDSVEVWRKATVGLGG